LPTIEPTPPTRAATILPTPETIADEGQAMIEALMTSDAAKKIPDHREKAFISAYLLRPNARQAALDAGYSDGTAKGQSYKWLWPDVEKNPKPWIFAALHANSEKIKQSAIKKASSTLAKRVIDAAAILDMSHEQYQKANAEIPTHTSTRIDPVSGATVEVKHFDYNNAGANKAIELMAKNKKVKAFSNEVEINTDSSLAGLLMNLSGQSGPPVIEHDISDAQIVDTPALTRPDTLPE